MNSIATIVVVIAIVAAIFIPLILWQGFVIHTMWLWFVVPLGVPPIGVVHAVGFALLIAMFRSDKPKTEDKKWGKALGETLMKSALVLGLGYLAKSWMAS